MKRTKREQIPSEYREIRNREDRIRNRLESSPIFYPEKQPWITDLGIGGKNDRR